MNANSASDPTPLIPHAPVPNPRRLFLYENGWRIEMKVGSDREFCYMTAPGQDFYHRLLDGEIYLARQEEKLCLACAERRGLLSYEPRTLRDRNPDLGRMLAPDQGQEPPAPGSPTPA